MSEWIVGTDEKDERRVYCMTARDAAQAFVGLHAPDNGPVLYAVRAHCAYEAERVKQAPPIAEQGP